MSKLVAGAATKPAASLRGGVEEAARKLRESCVPDKARGEPPYWPHTTPAAGYVLVECRSAESMPYSPARPTNPMKASEVHFTAAGLEQFTRALREGIRRAKSAAPVLKEAA